MELNDEIRAKISNAASVDEVVRICAEAGIFIPSAWSCTG